MSRTSLCLALVFLPVASLAAEPLPGESNDEIVTFDGDERLFKGIEEAYGFDLWEEGVGIYAKADSSADLTFIMEGLSHLEWPVVLDNSWGQTERGGTITLESKAKVWLEITGEILGVRLGYELWREQLEWSQTFDLRSILLEGTRQGATVSLSSTGDDIVAFEEELEVAKDLLYITVGGAVRPVTTVQVTGHTVQTDAGAVVSTADSMQLEAPESNEGFTEFDATWTGDVSGSIGLQLVPTITIKVDRFSFGPLQYPLDISLFEDTIELESDPSTVAHDLPAAQPGARTLDFGQVELGESATREITLHNLGNVVLSGVARVEGEGFVMPDENILVARTNGGGATEQAFQLDFLPAAEGTFTGSIVFETNDPVMPELIVPMVGVGISTPIDDPNGDPNDPGDGSGLVSTAGSGCGCSSTSPVGGLGAFALLGLVGLIARRRR